MRSAIIIGASSGIGRALAVILSLEGYRLDIVARRTELLEALQAELAGPSVIKTIDVAQPESAMPLVRGLIQELGDVELFIISAGTGFENAALAWEPERDTIAVNVQGFAAMVNVAVAHLETRRALLDGLPAAGSSAGRRSDPAAEGASVRHQALASHRMAHEGRARCAVPPALNRESRRHPRAGRTTTQNHEATRNARWSRRT